MFSLKPWEQQDSWLLLSILVSGLFDLVSAHHWLKKCVCCSQVVLLVTGTSSQATVHMTLHDFRSTPQVRQPGPAVVQQRTAWVTQHGTPRVCPLPCHSPFQPSFSVTPHTPYPHRFIFPSSTLPQPPLPHPRTLRSYGHHQWLSPHNSQL